jgi:hypothetical protein
MTDNGGLHHEMRHLRPRPDFGSDPLALDEGTAERLLAGRLDPADAPPEYVRAAIVLAAVTVPPTPDELAGEAPAVAALAAVARSSSRPPAHRRPTVISKVLSVKAAATAVIAALSVAGVASAATGTLPDPAQRAAHRMLGAAGVPGPDDHASASQGKSQSDHGSTAKGPDATGPAKDGLCRAWQAGQGGSNGGKNDSTAFQALAKAAGGADKIADFCKDTTAVANSGQEHGADSGTPPSTTPAQSQGDSHSAGSSQSGSDHSQGQGASPPSTTPAPRH